jgi:hypothetical protein
MHFWPICRRIPGWLLSSFSTLTPTTSVPCRNCSSAQPGCRWLKPLIVCSSNPTAFTSFRPTRTSRFGRAACICRRRPSAVVYACRLISSFARWLRRKVKKPLGSFFPAWARTACSGWAPSRKNPVSPSFRPRQRPRPTVCRTAQSKPALSISSPRRKNCRPASSVIFS